MLTRSLIVAATALAAATALSLPANAQTNKEVRGAVMFWLLDRNNDGAIDRSEVEALRTVIFDTVDTDDDGKVTREEFVAAIGERDGPWRERGDGPRHGQWEQRGRGDGPRGSEYAEHRGERMMDRLGIESGDGLNKDDFVGAAPLLFERADEDGNGSVSRDVFEQASRHIGRLLILE